MLRLSLRSPFRPVLRPIVMRAVGTHERGAPATGLGSAVLQPAAAKFFQRPVVWAAAALAGGGAAYALGHDALVQVRRSRAPTHVEIATTLSQAEVRRRMGTFAETLHSVEAVELHWWCPTTARMVGHYLEGDIRVREGWVDVTMRVHGPLRVRSQSLHSWMVANLRRIMEA